ncbi:hypothetical protein ASZ90_015745 [hydrocarbon metagenome]|uniref:Uncharacterized protein n=1 Tax=hydrocarbon metagenome TaxID=938273 RepID=A0A0W8F180_9ZZZZ
MREDGAGRMMSPGCGQWLSLHSLSLLAGKKPLPIDPTVPQVPDGME